MSALVKMKRGEYQLTREGFAYVTQLLEEEGYFPEIDMAGFEANRTWAGIMGTHMVEAGNRYLKAMGEKQKVETLDEDEESEVALVALYVCVAEAQIKDSMA